MVERAHVAQELAEAAAGGQVLDLTERDERGIRAAVIRDLLCGEEAADVDPRGVRLRGAHVSGELDLTDVRAEVPLVLHACVHEEAITLERAHLPHLDLSGSRFPVLSGDGVVVEHDLLMCDVRAGRLDLGSADITGVLSLNGAELAAADDEPALDADGLSVHGSFHCAQGFTARSDGADGTLRLASASISGHFTLDSARLTARDGAALHGDFLTIGRDLFCRSGFTARSDGADAALRLPGASIAGSLKIDGAQLIATHGPALAADGAAVGGDLSCNSGFTASSDSDLGVLRLNGATIGASFHLSRAELTATNGPALCGDSITIGGRLFARDGFTARSDGPDSTIRLLDATITGPVDVSSARLIATGGAVLSADRITIHGSLICGGGFTARSDGELGTVRLPGGAVTGFLDLEGAQLTATNGSALRANGATIAQDVELSGAHLRSTGGPALSADGITIHGSLNCRDDFRATSDGPGGTLRLNAASVGQQFSLDGARLSAADEAALSADGITVQGNVHCTGGFTAVSDSSEPALRLPGATIAGELGFRDASVRNAGTGEALSLGNAQVGEHLYLPLETFADDPDFLVDVAGLRYPFIPRDVTWQEWRDLLARHTSSYAAQPYQQLAAVHRDAGHDREARHVLIAQQRDLRGRGDLGGWGNRLLHAASGLFIGYGHRPWRALGFLVGVCALALGWVFTAHALGLAVRPGPGNAPCAPAELIGAAIDTSVPILKTGGGSRCEIAANTVGGQVLYLGGYALQAMGWAFATLFVAGYTGLIRKSA